MKAVVYDHYGPPDVLRKVHATTVNRLDVHTREANAKSGPAVSFLSRLVSGVRRPRQPILGSEFAGEVVAAGKAVREFAVGDHIFGTTGLGFGTHAEFMCVRESARIAHIPAGMSFEEAAAVTDGFLNALTGIKMADLRKGKS